MDHLALIVLACASIGAWAHAMLRKQTPFAWKVAAPVGITILVLYVGLEAMRTRGMWFSGQAEAGWLVIAVMGLGFSVSTGALDDKKQTGRA
jgi:methionine-rich copper-binding protein CopC